MSPHRNTSDSVQAEDVNPPLPPPPGATEPAHSRPGNKVYKSGPLFLASRGIGWTSWKKRWFILTRTSLVFFRSDPNSIPPKGEVNLTLGGIDLNSSGSVVVKEDKKLITVLFPDGKDGRAFTLKSESLEDLYEWKVALEEALASAPSAALGMGQNGIFKNDQSNASSDLSSDHSKDRQPVKSLVIGRPILLALEDIDGTPSFLEKALRFVEDYGVNAEGILRQAAYVDDVERRIREYEQGKTEFGPGEDAHVIADCVKYILRELPSSPVPASCCNALLEACRVDRSMRVSAMRNAICETFPEPNRRLLQRILTMMQSVAANKAHNRMSISAVAACMAPLLLRPLLQGDCEPQQQFDVASASDDGQMQLLQAAAAANHAQAIVITLLEEYDSLFGEGTGTPELYSETDESGSESEELSEDYESSQDNCDDDVTVASDSDIIEHFEHISSLSASETEDKDEGSGSSRSRSQSGLEWISEIKESKEDIDISEISDKAIKLHPTNDSEELTISDPPEFFTPETSTNATNETTFTVKRRNRLGRNPAKKNLSAESIELPDEEVEIYRLEAIKAELQQRIAEEAKVNQQLQESLERRRNALHERRLSLEKEVARLREQLQKEKELRSVLEAGLKVPQGPIPVSSCIDEKMKGQIEEIAQAELDVCNLKQIADELGAQLNQQREQNSQFPNDSNFHTPPIPNHHRRFKDKQIDVEIISSHMTKSRSKHDERGESEKHEKHKKKEFSSISLKSSPQHPKSAGFLSESEISKSTSSNSKKSGSRGEGNNSTTSALSKLTNRLNFLKERRTQIANEIQNRDSSQPNQSMEKEKGKSGSRKSSNHNVDKNQGSSSEGQSRVDNNNYQPPPSPSPSPSPDPGRRIVEGQPNLERGKSESFPIPTNVDKNNNNQSVTTSRTYSR